MAQEAVKGNDMQGNGTTPIRANRLLAPFDMGRAWATGSMVTRRAFVASACAFVALKAHGAEKPLWKAGIVTDTHVLRTRESCERVQKACALFAAQGVDLFVNCGDIADHHYPEAYPILKELSDAAFPAKPPKKIWVFANHDHIDRQDEPWENVMADVKRLLGATNDVYDIVDMQGYPLVVFPQWIDIARAEKMLSEVYADPKYVGKPVFVFDHVPPANTTEHSVTWGSASRRALYAKFPRVIDITGHSHGSLRCEGNIWQGEFTSVNMGCLQNWGGHLVGAAPTAKPNYGAVVMEVFPDRVVFRRFDVRTGEEYGADDPWTVPLPFDPATAPYRRDAAVRREPVPQFPAGAILSLEADDPFTAVKMTFPRAESRHGTFIYKVQVLAHDGEQLARTDMSGQFYLPERDRAATLVRMLSGGYFAAGTRYRVRLTPCNCFGVGGQPLEADFTAPSSCGFETLFESNDPMAECPFMTGLADGKRIQSKDGWYQIGSGNYRLEFPDGIWKGKGRYRFSVDMETKQGDLRFWSLVLRNPKPISNACSRIATPFGDSGKMRYVVEFGKSNSDFFYYLLVREGEKGGIRFSRVKIERFVDHIQKQGG